MLQEGIMEEIKQQKFIMEINALLKIKKIWVKNLKIDLHNNDLNQMFFTQKDLHSHLH